MILTGGETVTLAGPELVGIYLEQLRKECRNYLGALNEISMGIKRKEMPEKPEALYLYDLCQETGMRLVQGELMDQPHLWLMEWQVCHQERKRFDAMQERSRRQNAAAQTSDPGVHPGIQ